MSRYVKCPYSKCRFAKCRGALCYLLWIFVQVVFQDLLEEAFPDGEGQRVANGRVNLVDGVVAIVQPETGGTHHYINIYM